MADTSEKQDHSMRINETQRNQFWLGTLTIPSNLRQIFGLAPPPTRCRTWSCATILRRCEGTNVRMICGDEEGILEVNAEQRSRAQGTPRGVSTHCPRLLPICPPCGHGHSGAPAGAPAVSGGGSRDPQQEGQTAGGPPVSERQSSGPWPLPNLVVQFYKKMKGKYS